MQITTTKIYGNCQVLSPDGVLMFRCDFKKANWYLNRELAIELHNDPLIIRLTFEPKGLGNYNKPFGLESLENKCVSCADNDLLTRHHIIPFCYRRFFPDNYKNHNHHDVLPLCIKCHNNYEKKADELKSILSDKYNAPIDGRFDNIDNMNIKIAKLATTLSQYSSYLTDEKKEDIVTELSILLDSDDFLDNLEELMNRHKPVFKRTHGQIVVEQIESIDDFIIIWRKHFIDNCNPQYLPENWRINNPTK